MKSPIEILQKYYGYKCFRKNQKDIITSIINKKDVLSIMPTGAGKSVCYQIPAMMFEGITIVISPLISLMKDQVDSLVAYGINATFINSSLSNIELEEILYGIKNNKYKLLYIAPERLESLEFLNVINNVNISQIAIDEAHCISQWGHDFRVSYRKIPHFISKLNNKPVVTAFTATASDEVRKDIVNLLKLDNPQIFINGFNRENLKIIIIKEQRKDEFLYNYINKNNDISGIIYCATRKEVDNIYNKLINEGVSVARYHAGLSEKERKENQERFVKDNISLMIATNAFGMGIDKPNVRYVIHYNMPQTIENYYQEIGRAGRDGEESECILLFTPGDIQIQKYLIDNTLVNEERKIIAYKKLNEMKALVYSTECYRKKLLNYFGENYNDECKNCSNCLSEGEIVDKTIDAQKVLSCIYRMKKNFGISMIVNVLRGSKDAKIKAQQFERLTTYGIMKEYKKEELTTFINGLISKGYIDIVLGSYPVVKLNNLSIDIIKGKEKVYFKEVKKVKKIYKENELFTQLKELRYNIALEKKLAPYMIFGDSTLKEMSNLYPLNKEELIDLSGVGEKKLEEYGDSFIKVISEYVSSNNIDKNSLRIKKADNYKLYIKTDDKLYVELRKLREGFAKIENKSAYSIISQNTLKEISGRYPINLEELKDISGLGPVKIKKYGEQIISLVNDYVKNGDINRNWRLKGKSLIVIDEEERENKQISIDMLKEGYTVEEISNKIEISISTILGYVTEYIEEGNELNIDLKLNKYFTEEEEEIILEACEKNSYKKISVIKKSIPSYIKYESIRGVILKKYYKCS